MYKIEWIYNRSEAFSSRWMRNQWVDGGVVYVRPDKYIYLADDRLIVLPTEVGTHYYLDNTVAIIIEATRDVWLAIWRDDDGTV